MRSSYRCAALGLLMAMWGGLGAQTLQTPQAPRPAPPPADAFFSPPRFSGAQLAPDGQRVAMLVGAQGARTRLAVLDLASMKASVVASFAVDDISRFQWVSDQRLVFELGIEMVGPGRARAGPGLYAVNADGSGYRQLVQSLMAFVTDPDTDRQLHANYRLLGRVQGPSGADIVVTRPREISNARVGYFDLQRVNTLTGHAQEMDAPLHTQDWVFDAAGQLRAAQALHEGQLSWHLRQGDGAWKQIAQVALTGATAALLPEFFAPDGAVYASGPVGDKAAVFRYDPASGKAIGAPVAVSKEFDIKAQYIANEHQLLGLRYTIDAEITQWLDPDMDALQKAIDARLTQTANRLSVPQHGKAPWVLVQAFADVQPTLSYVFNRQTNKLTLLGNARPQIDPRQMGLTDFVRVPARDGRVIPAYLTLPPGGKTKALPLVLLVHGGPWVRGMEWQWDAQVQFLASRGYAVLQPEFRGSRGFGADHFEAGFKQWGRAMQHDLADVARWAVAQGTADAQRICIAGASYGGYAALMGLIQDADLFRCGISWAGVTDPALLFGLDWSDITQEFKRYGLGQMLGDPVKDADQLAAASPLRLAARIKQPLLLAHGAWDLRVPIEHGERLRDAVRPHNPALEWRVYDNEGHGWARIETQIDFWGRVERFLAAHLGPP